MTTQVTTTIIEETITTTATVDLRTRKMAMLMGIPVDNLTMDETLDRIEQFVEVGRATGRTHQVATVNTDFLIKAASDSNLRTLLQNADLCTADGMPLVWGSKMLGTPLKERVAGSDLVPLLAERAAQNGMSIYMMGALPGVAAQAAEVLVEQYPGLTIAGVSCPYWKPGEEMDAEVMADIKNSGADILLVAFGNPKQELWIQEFGAETGIPVAIGVGATFDFIAGTVARAPEWMQNSGLEWLARLAQEPRRLTGRYASNFAYFPQVARQWWMMRSQAEDAAPFRIQVRTIGQTSILNLEGALDDSNSHIITDHAYRALGSRRSLTLNMAGVTSMTGSAVAALLETVRQTRARGGELRIVGVRSEMSRIFNGLTVDSFFGINETSLMHGVSANY